MLCESQQQLLRSLHVLHLHDFAIEYFSTIKIIIDNYFHLIASFIIEVIHSLVIKTLHQESDKEEFLYSPL